jgi:hypothetical protein
MVKLTSVAARGDDTATAINALDAKLGAVGSGISAVFAFYGCHHDDPALHAFLIEKFPGAAIVGGTSCTGMMTEAGMWGADAIGLLLIEDPAGDYGAAAAPLGEDPAATAERLLHAALAAAGCPGELPELVWVYQAPGHEEAVIEGLRRLLGDRCPIVGGSAADNSVAGEWRQLGPDGVLSDGLVVAVLFPSGGIGYAFQGGYEPAGPNGVVTRIDSDPTGQKAGAPRTSGRRILSIDHAPAAEVYNSWIGDRLAAKLKDGGQILLDTTMSPLAIEAGSIEGVPHFLLIHPESITPDGALRTFAAIEDGARVFSMRGDRRRLIERAGRVAAEAAARLPGGPSSLAGGIMVYCAGCKLAVGEEMPKVAREVTARFDRMPFIGCFTFGEQGRIVDRNRHGNLMIAAIAFGG